ncbi:YqiA/YcfP family alpha/beta fold hydrolase [Alteromonas lipolytica]|uniref:Esterase YqiA n=1 Tax=Alteromonas lipolytica TaxID=1856405 RepID=A0A1E8FEY6_9ALTE|nr:YqiA/YcfP family alpha/beta fold hydrolase [Alteromonas lipolytica]OFI34484.1 esterase YqiA [Alteromonas lipolytica]GGF84943.1 esterase YqiA [Alteromonas lipolytica]
MSSLLYLHGFLSSPASVKATQTRDYLQQHAPGVAVICPELENSPARLKPQLLELMAGHAELSGGDLRVIGSSMGGYLATWLVEQYGGKAVLVNPAVRPFELLAGYLGEHINPYTNKHFALNQDDIGHIQAFYQPTLARPANYRVLLQSGDETLDYQQAVAHYQGAELCIEEGGDHSFVGYEQHLPSIMRFLYLQ